MRLAVLLVFLLAVCTGSTQADNSGQTPAVQTFADKLEKNLKNKSVGFAFTVSYQDKWMDMRSGGKARIKSDGTLAMSPLAPFSAASLSKTITAAAAVKALDAKDQQQPDSKKMLDKPIGPWLPTEFNAGAHFKAITFRQLLTHTSGIGTAKDAGGKSVDAAGVDYVSLKDYVGSHPDLSSKNAWYSNTNYALFRFLIPNVVNGSPLVTNDPAADYAAAYMSYVQKHVFDPVALYRIPAATDSATGVDYHFPLSHPADPSYHGWDLGDLTLQIGSQGWVMSTQQLAVFLRDLNFTEKIVRKELSQQMKATGACLGYEFWSCAVPVAKNSSYLYWEKGGFYPGCSQGNKLPGEFRGHLVVFSNDVSIALFVNSNLTGKGATKDACGFKDRGSLQAILDAFNSTIGK
jgi:CubicO group peptidase (beta-lactamase class C family)